MLYSLQACRAAAAFLVVLFHLGGTFAQDRYFGFKALDGPFAWGDAGVDFFFVLSGFLITSAHRCDFGRPQALRAYVFKRLVRIYPTYWLICGAVCLAALAVPALRPSLPADVQTFLLGLALVPLDPGTVGGTGSPILFVAWSLQYEMLFYAVVALLIVRRTAGVLAALALVIAHLGCQLVQGCGFPQSFVASNMIFLFGMGVAAAYVAGSGLRVRAPLAWAWMGGLLFIGFGIYEVVFGRHTLPLDRGWVYGALAAVVVLGLARAEAEGALVVRKRWPGLLGDSSYALYLLHIPVISVLVKVVAGLHVSNPAALVAAYLSIFLCCVALSVLFYAGIERPMLAWFKRRLAPAGGTGARSLASGMPARPGVSR